MRFPSLTVSLPPEKLPYHDSDLRAPRRRPRRWIGYILGVVTLFIMISVYRDMGEIRELPSSLGPLQLWGSVSPTRSELLGSLSPWPPRMKTKSVEDAFSALGPPADLCYNSGPSTLQSYEAQLRQFIGTFPEPVRGKLYSGLTAYLHDGELGAWDENKVVWQTDKDGSSANSDNVRSWHSEEMINEGWDWRLLPDEAAWKWAEIHLKDGLAWNLWNNLPTGILRADLLRYLLLLVHGGIYTDTDTFLLHTPSHWGADAKAWKGGEGWMSEAQRKRYAAGESLETILGKPSIVVGIEADVADDRRDWAQWWPRPVQVVQWTMAAAPYHPITMQAVLRVLHATADAADWARARSQILRAAYDQLHRQPHHSAQWNRTAEQISALLSTSVVSPVNEGGPVGILDWTGPGVWTDSVLAYLQVKYGVKWTDLRNIREPIRIGDVVILSVTGFSPGVGQFGAGLVKDEQAMAWHQFRGSWREGGDAQVKPMSGIENQGWDIK